MYMKILVAVIFLSFCSPLLGQNSLDCRLALAPVKYVIRARNLADATARIASDFGIPLGIEWLDNPASVPIDASFELTPVKNILESVVRAQPGYDLDFKHGVVHVFSVEVRDRPENFLNAPIPSFAASDEYIRVVDNRLRRAVANDANLISQKRSTAGGCAGSFAVGGGERRISFSLKNVLVREILDEEIKIGGYPIWIVTFPQKRTKLTPAGYFFTESVSDPTFPDSAQPAWNLLFWGFEATGHAFEPGWKPSPLESSCPPAALTDNPPRP
jgi:hypothetical protein